MHSILTETDQRSLLDWYTWLDRNRGDKAMLRRVSAPDDALLLPAFSHFLEQMPSTWKEGKKISLSDSALIATAISHVKQNDLEINSFARAMATPKKEGGSKAAMNELRFQQLQKSRTPEEFSRRIIRAINLLGGRVNICSLADDILLWLRESRYGPARKPMDRLAVRWATEYYQYLRD